VHADTRAARGDANVYAASIVVLMFMAFGQMQPHSSRHHYARDQQLCAQRLMKQSDRRHGSKKWFSGEVRAGARAAEIAQCHHEKGQTHSVGEGLTSIPGISAINH
jgi:hypothetical protein